MQQIYPMDRYLMKWKTVRFWMRLLYHHCTKCRDFTVYHESTEI